MAMLPHYLQALISNPTLAQAWDSTLRQLANGGGLAGVGATPPPPAPPPQAHALTRPPLPPNPPPVMAQAMAARQLDPAAHLNALLAAKQATGAGAGGPSMVEPPASSATTTTLPLHALDLSYLYALPGAPGGFGSSSAAAATSRPLLPPPPATASAGARMGPLGGVSADGSAAEELSASEPTPSMYPAKQVPPLPAPSQQPLLPPAMHSALSSLQPLHSSGLPSGLSQLPIAPLISSIGGAAPPPATSSQLPAASRSLLSALHSGQDIPHIRPTWAPPAAPPGGPHLAHLDLLARQQQGFQPSWLRAGAGGGVQQQQQASAHPLPVKGGAAVAAAAAPALDKPLLATKMSGAPSSCRWAVRACALG